MFIINAYTSPIENWDASLLIEEGKLLKVVVEQGLLIYWPSDNISKIG